MLATQYTPSITLSVTVRFLQQLNHLTPNGHYMGRIAQLTSRCCTTYIFIQQIYVLNILNMLHNLLFFSSKCHLFLVPVLFTF